MTDFSRRKLLKCAGICSLAALTTGTSNYAIATTPPPPKEPPAEFAKKRFLSHWNCTQAVVESLAFKHKADLDTAMRMATGFAGGMTTGNTCGSVTAAYMVIGLAHGEEGAPQSDVAKRIADFNEAFEKEFGALSCSELMGTDMGTQEGVSAAAKKGNFTTICPKIVQMTVEELERLL